MKPLYSLRGIEKNYGPKVALHIDALDLYPGHIYCLCGPNGAGKSSLLQVLAFLSRPNRGRLSFQGEPLRWTAPGLRASRSLVTLVHQSPYLFDTSVQENLAFGLKARGIPAGREQQLRIERILEQVGLEGYGPRRARQLSGGEAQRVALARSLMLEPAVLLLDEPVASLQQEMIPVLESLLRDCRDRGATVILSTHDPEQPTRLGSERIRMETGRLLRAGPRCAAEGAGTRPPKASAGAFTLEVSNC